MVEGIAIVVGMLFFFGMATLGMVLLVAFFASGHSRGRKVLFAALGGPGSFFLLMAPLALLDTPVWSTLLGIVVIVLFSSAIVGWPVAYFATRRLDRLTRFDSSTFD